MSEEGERARRKDARNAALDCLARREHSAHELRAKLVRKGYDADDVAQVVSALQAERLVSDQRFVEMMIQARRRRGYGPVRIAQELKEKGISTEVISSCLDFTDDMWVHEIERVRDRKFGPARPDDASARAKQMRFLQYRGFTTEQIRRALNSRGRD